MFTKTRGNRPQSTGAPAPNGIRRPSGKPKPNRGANARPATLGPSISISGNLSGNEDLVIEGSVEGEVMVRGHIVTISRTGKVKADVYGRSICVEGEVEGDLFGEEQVIIRQSGRVRGNVTAPKVNLESGAKFKGSIDMKPVVSTQEKAEIAKKPRPDTDEGRRRSAAATPRTPGMAGETA